MKDQMQFILVADYYNDYLHHYTFHEKLDEVYQWHNGFFSRSREAKKGKPISAESFVQLSKSPQDGRMLEDFRVTPYFLGYEVLPKSLTH